MPPSTNLVAPSSLSRLWPDPSDMIKALTRWTPPSFRKRSKPGYEGEVEFYGPIRSISTSINNSNGGNANPFVSKRTGNNSSNTVPREFRNASEMLETMAPLLLDEGMSSLNGEYHRERRGNDRWNRDVYCLKLLKLTEVSPIFQTKSYFGEGIKMYEAQFSSSNSSSYEIGDTNIPPSNLSELYCIHEKGWDCCAFGIVAHDFPTTISFRQRYEKQAFLRLWLVVHDDEEQTKNTGWLSKNDLKKLLDPHKNGLMIRDGTILTLMSCGSTTNVVRQFEAIQSLPYLSLHIQRAIFTPNIVDPSKYPSTAKKPRSLPVDIWTKLTNSHNTLQLKSIAHVLSGFCHENLCLIQGPPGTGKSSTIVGLVSALLSGRAPMPKQRQSACIIHPPGGGQTMGVTSTTKTHCRILVCAATNIAVDSLAWKIKNGSLGPSGKVGDFNMARYGSLPWENVRDRNSTDQKPKSMSAIDEFLYEINVDRRASDDEDQEFEYNYEEQNHGQCWSPEKQKHNHKKRRRIVGRAAHRLQILRNCNVIITTLSGAGSKAFIDAVCRDPTRNDSEFDAVIIDEACQASEAETLIPFKFNPITITLVGDPKQLPVLSLSGSSSSKLSVNLFERSLFERLQQLDFPSILLRTQYRMHRDIAAFPSKQFYNGMLITPDCVNNRPTPLWLSQCFPTICFWDIKGDMSAVGNGWNNAEEASFITRTILAIFAQTWKRPDIITVGIISFYKDQVSVGTYSSLFILYLHLRNNSISLFFSR